MNKKQHLQLVTFDQAKRLKEAGFDWDTEYHYGHNNELTDRLGCINHNAVTYKHSAPTVALALRWFREEKKIPCTVRAWSNFKYGWEYCYKYNHWNTSMYDEYDTHCNAESALLDQLLTLIEKEK